MSGKLLRPLFSYFGGKRKVAAEVWRRFGEVKHYVEPFCGSCAVLLGRPGWHPGVRWSESVNDASGALVNALRAVKFFPEEVIDLMRGQVSEADFKARKEEMEKAGGWLLDELRANPYFCVPKFGAWWIMGTCWAIGRSWDRDPNPCLAMAPEGALSRSLDSEAIVRRVSERFQDVRIAAGDWKRLVSSKTKVYGVSYPRPVGIFLDPPYEGHEALFETEGESCSAEAREWCLEAAERYPEARVALCGYGGEHEELEAAGWSVHAWQSVGRGHQNESERVWFSPSCEEPEVELFEAG